MMKKINLILVTAFVLLLTACGTSTNSRSQHEKPVENSSSEEPSDVSDEASENEEVQPTSDCSDDESQYEDTEKETSNSNVEASTTETTTTNQSQLEDSNILPPKNTEEQNLIPLALMKAIRWHYVETGERYFFQEKDLISTTCINFSEDDFCLTKIQFDINGKSVKGYYNRIYDLNYGRFQPLTISDIYENSLFIDSFHFDQNDHLYYEFSNWYQAEAFLKYVWCFEGNFDGFKTYHKDFSYNQLLQILSEQIITPSIDENFVFPEDEYETIALAVMQAIEWHDVETEEVYYLQEEDLIGTMRIWIEHGDGPLTIVYFDTKEGTVYGFYDAIRSKEYGSRFPWSIDAINDHLVEFSPFTEYSCFGTTNFEFDSWEEAKLLIGFAWCFHKKPDCMSDELFLQLLSDYEFIDKEWRPYKYKH